MTIINKFTQNDAPLPLSISTRPFDVLDVFVYFVEGN